MYFISDITLRVSWGLSWASLRVSVSVFVEVFGYGRGAFSGRPPRGTITGDAATITPVRQAINTFSRQLVSPNGNSVI